MGVLKVTTPRLSSQARLPDSGLALDSRIRLWKPWRREGQGLLQTPCRPRAQDTGTCRGLLRRSASCLTKVLAQKWGRADRRVHTRAPKGDLTERLTSRVDRRDTINTSEEHVDMRDKERSTLHRPQEEQAPSPPGSRLWGPFSLENLSP